MHNTASEEYLVSYPLIAFSWLTHTQVATVNSLGAKLIRKLSNMLREEGVVDGPSFVAVYGLFWVWVLAAFEVTRTMSGARACFSAPALAQLVVLKKQLILLRAPFAKQELPGVHRRIRGETSVHGVDFRKRDLRFVVSGKTIFARDLILAFRRTMRGIERHDVLHEL